MPFTCEREPVLWIRAGRRALRPLPGLVIFAFALSASCASALVHPTHDDARYASARWPEANLEHLERGRKLYVQSCAGCHNLVRPEAIAPDAWPERLDEMAVKAKIAPEEREPILHFLIAASTRLRSTPNAVPAAPR